MKSTILIIAIVLITMVIKAQSDIIFPEEGNKPIRHCKITEVRNGHTVYYIKNFITDSVEAVAISKDGNYITFNSRIEDSSQVIIAVDKPQLFEGHNYDYYGRLQSNALIKRNVGVGLTFFGVGCAIGGSLGLINSPGDKGATLLYLGGAIIGDLGIVLWISGGIKASNNKDAMEKVQKNTSLSFGPTNNGVGLILKYN